MNRRRTLALTLALPLLAGCGAAGDLASTAVGVHDAPAERSDGGSVTAGTAREVTERVVADAREATATRGSAGERARRASLAGPALREADASAATAAKGGRATTPKAETAPEAEVLAVSEGPSWPRTILATSRAGSEQRLHVLVAREAGEPYRVFADVPMAPGASVPAVADPVDGSPVRVEPSASADVAAAVQGWSRALAHPAPSSRPRGVSVDDDFSRALRTNASELDDDLDDLATYRQQQRTAKGDVLEVALADGGQLAFVPMTRTDMVRGGSQLRELTLDDPAAARLAGGSTLRDRLSVTHAETVAVVVPPEGAARVVGVSEQLEAAKGS